MTSLAELWRRPDMWRALARRDLGEVYRLLCAHGMTQQEIGALTRQSQSEVSAIMAGRQVMSYDLLERIADGLGIPRGQLGLAYEPALETTEPHSVSRRTRPGLSRRRRRLVAPVSPMSNSSIG